MVDCPHCGRRPVVGHVSGGSVSFISGRDVFLGNDGDVPAPLDFDLLAEIVEAVEAELSSNAVVMTPADKAETIVGLYELALEDAAGDVPARSGGDVS